MTDSAPVRFEGAGAPSEEQVRRILRQCREKGGRIRRLSAARRCELVGRLGPLWAEGGAARDAFMDSRPEKTLGWSSAMIGRGLDHFASLLNKDRALARVEAQLGDPLFLDGFRPRAGRVARAEPLGVVLHVISDTLFFGPAESLLAGLLTGNANLVKAPDGGSGFLRLFVESMHEAAGELADGATLLGWRGGTEKIERLLASEADGIVISAEGGTISAYRRYAAPATVLVEFGPRVSVAVVSAGGEPGLDIDGLALDVALWEQMACTGAQCVYVEGEERAGRLAARLSEALSRCADLLPEGAAALDERIEVARMRDLARFASSTGQARLFPCDREGTTTVVLEKDPAFRDSPLRRCVRVKAYSSPEELEKLAGSLRGTLQTVGLAVGEGERARYLEILAAAGARRICGIGFMNLPAPEALHDGVMELQRLLRWVEVEQP